MVDVNCYNGKDGGVATVTVDTSPLGEKVRKRLLRQAVLHYAAARRLGTHSTKTRAEVSSTTRKPWRQKGTGRARAGDFASPIWRGGGVVFGPKPRNYTSNFPRRMRREALRSSLLGKLQDGEVSLVDGLHFDRPSTKQAMQVLQTLGAEGGRTVIVIAERGDNLQKSFRNISRVDIRLASDLHAEDVIACRNLILDRKALDHVVARVGNA